MDWNNLRDQVSNISLYDIKAGVRKVQNAVMNYTEMEAKVREATNNEKWGASSTQLQEIANGTFNYQQLNEIMPMIYKRFTEKSAEEWRQIYKALQLLEFLIKNGSERVIDDARSHLSLLKMLRQFHYIDSNGKDQGINVRNRAKELGELLSDVDKIRAERKKAKSNRNKFGGVEGGAGLGPSSSGRYGGFGSETGGSSSYGGATRGVYGDGGGFGGESHDDYDEAGRRAGAERFDEYDEYDDGGATAPKRRTDVSSKTTTAKRAAPAKPKEPEVDLFDFGDDPPAAAPSNGASLLAPTVSAPAPIADDDDFDDFQSAAPPPQAASSSAFQAAAPSSSTIPKPNYSSFALPAPTATTQIAQPQPQLGSQKADLGNLFATSSPAAATSAFSAPPQGKATGYQPSGPNYYSSVPVAQASTPTPTSATPSLLGSSQAAKKTTGATAGGDAFASLLAGSGIKKNAPTKGMTIADMAKQKSTAGLYGANAATPQYSANTGTTSTPKASTGSNGLDDLLG